MHIRITTASPTLFIHFIPPHFIQVFCLRNMDFCFLSEGRVCRICLPNPQCASTQSDRLPKAQGQAQTTEVTSRAKMQGKKYPCRYGAFQIQQHIKQQTQKKASASLCPSHAINTYSSAIAFLNLLLNSLKSILRITCAFAGGIS